MSIKLIITMSCRWLLHYGREFISKNLEISRRTEVNRRDLVGLVLQAKCESQAFFISFALVPDSAARKIHKAKVSFRPRSLCFERCEAIRTKHNAIQY